LPPGRALEGIAAAHVDLDAATPSACSRSATPARTRSSSPAPRRAPTTRIDQARPLLRDLELDDVAVAGDDGELHRHERDRAPVRRRQPDDVLGASLDALEAPQRAAAGARRALSVTASEISRRMSGCTRLTRLVTSRRAPGVPSGTARPSSSTFSTMTSSSKRCGPSWRSHSPPHSPSVVA
jgi:hypothetical protein